jgi:hypothetical protein
MTFGQQQHILDRKPGCVHERVDSCNGLLPGQIPAQVVGRSRRRGDRQPRDMADLIVGKSLVTHHEAGLWPGVWRHQLNGNVGVHPLCTVQR